MMFSFFSFGGKEPSSPEYHEQLLSLTKQLELRLYQSAPSFDAYLDMFTASRLKQLAIRVATETWPSCAQLVKAALQSRERNELQRQYEHNVAALQKEVDCVINEKTTVDAQLKEALVELKAKESLIGDKEEALEQLQLLQQQRDTEVKSLKLKYETMIVENTTLAAEKAKAVDEAKRAALESKSLLEDVQALNTKYDKLKVVTQSMEKDVIESYLKDRKIKALSEKVKALTNAANEAVVAKANVVVQYRKSELSKRFVLLQQTINDEKARAETALEKKAKEVQVLKSEKMFLIEQINESLESERTYLQQQLGSLLRIDHNEDMEQQRNVIKLNERIKSLQQAHDDALSSIRHEYEVVLSEKRLLEQERARRLSGGRPPRLSSEGAIRGSDLTNHLHCMGSPTSMPMRFPGKFRERASRTILPASRPSNDSLRQSSFERPGQQSTSKPFESPHPRNNWIAPQETPTLHQTVISCLET